MRLYLFWFSVAFMPFFSWGMEVSSLTVSLYPKDIWMKVSSFCIDDAIKDGYDVDVLCKTRMGYCPSLNELQFVNRSLYAIFSKRENSILLGEYWLSNRALSQNKEDELKLLKYFAATLDLNMYPHVQRLCKSDLLDKEYHFNKVFFYRQDFREFPYFFIEFFYTQLEVHLNSDSLLEGQKHFLANVSKDAFFYSMSLLRLFLPLLCFECEQSFLDQRYTVFKNVILKAKEIYTISDEEVSDFKLDDADKTEIILSFIWRLFL